MRLKIKRNSYRMTKQQICEKFNISDSYLTKNFKKAQASILKKHKVLIQKQGRGKDAIYIITKDESRAVTLYNQDKKMVMLDQQSIIELNINMEFVVFLGIIMTPLEVFRGSYNDFLKYVEVDVSPKNRQNLKQILEVLKDKQYIHRSILS